MEEHSYEHPQYLQELAADDGLLHLTKGHREHSFVHTNPGLRRLDFHYYFDPIGKVLHGAVHWGPDAVMEAALALPWTIVWAPVPGPRATVWLP